MAYNKFISSIKKYPFVLNGIASFSLFTASDMLAQYLENNNTKERNKLMNDNEMKHERIDYCRLASAGIIGIFFGVGVYPTAYARLDKMWPRSNFQSIMKKSIVEIMTVGVFVNSLSIFSRGVLAGKDKDEVLDHVKHEMPAVTLNDARVWLPYNMIAFSIIPLYIRPTTTAMMESAWQTYISLRSNDYEKFPTMPQKNSNDNNLNCDRINVNDTQTRIKL
mmetsp:Transcript_6376/g.7895  ORF Transcript_6376/g.7895 Transcript_6376/m.7895 type:complete len:221 (-) Transcript_6376:7-669(-)